MRNTLRCCGVGVLVLSFVLAFLTPAFASAPTDAGCRMSCCRLGSSMTHGKAGHRMPAMPSCGSCNLRSGNSGASAVLPAGLPPSVLPALAALPVPSCGEALLVAPGGRLVRPSRDLPDQPPRG